MLRKHVSLTIKDSGCEKIKTNRRKQLKVIMRLLVVSIQRGPTCSTPLQNPTAIDERQQFFFFKDPTTFSSILMPLIQFWTKKKIILKPPCFSPNFLSALCSKHSLEFKCTPVRGIRGVQRGHF
jgi:hypothetical protein